MQRIEGMPKGGQDIGPFHVFYPFSIPFLAHAPFTLGSCRINERTARRTATLPYGAICIYRH
jgi:hypothetical protein